MEDISKRYLFRDIITYFCSTHDQGFLKKLLTHLAV